MNHDRNEVIESGSGLVLYHYLLIAGTALAVIVDGFDNQLLGTVVPTLMEEWKLQRKDFSTPLAMSPLGMLFGAAIGGWLGDRKGRRFALILSLFSFAVPTAGIYFANGTGLLSLLRFLAGIGLGGAMPNATALVSEFVPKSKRPVAVTLVIVCIPVGAMLAAFLSAQVVPVFGWQVFFLVGGLVPIGLGLVLAMILPESPHFLSTKPHRQEEFARVMRRLGRTINQDSELGDQIVGRVKEINVSTRKLISSELRRETIALCVAFFSCLLVVYLALQLLVTALQGVGFSPTQANNVLGWWNIGGIAGALAGSLLIQRFGSRKTMLGLSGLAVVIGFMIASKSIGPADRVTLVLICLVLGGAINAVQVALYALASHVYPTTIRGRGIGTVLTVGRLGNILASYIGVAVLDLGGTSAYFMLFGIGMAVVFSSLAVIRQHIDGAH